MTCTIATTRDWRSYWEAIGKDISDDVFSQVGRTVGGIAIGAYQIKLLAASINRHLYLRETDTLLDLCCGNGLVTTEFARICRLVVGVDYSPPLIDEASRRYSAPNVVFLCRSATELTPADFPDGYPKKICMNQGLQFFRDEMLNQLLESVKRGAVAGCALYLTDIPDAGKIDAFCKTPERRAEFEHRRAMSTEAIGTWWDRNHLVDLIEAAGYAAQIIDPEPERFTSHYRFDLLARLRR